MSDSAYPTYNKNSPSKHVKCDPQKNRLEFWDGFEDAVRYRMAPGPVIFEVGGFTNPAAVDKQSLKVTTVSFDTAIYVIDHSDTGFDSEFTTGLITVESFLPSDT